MEMMDVSGESERSDSSLIKSHNKKIVRLPAKNQI